jgi:hypothetical protein
MKRDIAIIKAKSREALTGCQTSDFTKCFARWHDRWARSQAPGRQWSWQHDQNVFQSWRNKMRPDTAWLHHERPVCCRMYCTTLSHNGNPQMHLWGAWWCFRACEQYASNQHSPLSPWRITGHSLVGEVTRPPHTHLGSKTRVASWYGCNATTCSRCVSLPKSALCGYGYTVLTGPLHYNHFERLRGLG